MIDAARGGNEQAFRSLAEPHRRALVAHCYRMCGSTQQAEDLVQEAMLRAWRGLDRYAARASFKNWLYKIATNATIDRLRQGKVRTLPVYASEPSAPTTTHPPLGEPIWIEPFPDALLPQTVSPDAALSLRQSVRLAFLQALQQLPPTQRAAILLKEVVGLRVGEIAEVLSTTVAAVNSMLQRGRSTLRRAGPPREPDAREQAVVQMYMHAFASENVDAFVSLLRNDAHISMPPIPSWYTGLDNIRTWMCANVFTGPVGGNRFRMTPTWSNGQPAVAAYLREESGQFALAGVHLLDVVDGEIASLIVFLDRASLPCFGLPMYLPE